MPGVWVFAEAGVVVEEADDEAAGREEIEGVDAEEMAHRICGARDSGGGRA